MPNGENFTGSQLDLITSGETVGQFNLDGVDYIRMAIFENGGTYTGREFFQMYH